jgi:uncharacterized iron-regulated protein
MKSLIGAVVLAAPLLCAPAYAVELPPAARSADVVFLGEVHDNPHHHDLQADWVRALQPSAIVFEMLPEDLDADAMDAAREDPVALANLLRWEESGWPDFAMYHPIFIAAPNATIHGAAITREDARALMSQPLAEAFGTDAARFGLDQALAEDEQAARETLQHLSHCQALPAEMLPVMVSIQRLRDAALARAALRALAAAQGGPIVVITGNGHARTDWGAPALLAQASDLRLFALGQSEDGHDPEGRFDMVVDAPGIERPDPCEAFRN